MGACLWVGSGAGWWSDLIAVTLRRLVGYEGIKVKGYLGKSVWVRVYGWVRRPAGWVFGYEGIWV